MGTQEESIGVLDLIELAQVRRKGDAEEASLRTLKLIRRRQIAKFKQKVYTEDWESPWIKNFSFKKTKPTYFYHGRSCADTLKTWGKKIWLYPRRVGTHRPDTEPDVERTCVCDNIWNIFTATEVSIDADRFNPAFFIYRTVQPEVGVYPVGVSDWNITQERWLLHAVEFELCLVIVDGYFLSHVESLTKNMGSDWRIELKAQTEEARNVRAFLKDSGVPRILFPAGGNLVRVYNKGELTTAPFDSLCGKKQWEVEEKPVEITGTASFREKFTAGEMKVVDTAAVKV